MLLLWKASRFSEKIHFLFLTFVSLCLSHPSISCFLFETLMKHPLHTQHVDEHCKNRQEFCLLPFILTHLLLQRENLVNGESQLLMERESYWTSLTWTCLSLKTVTLTSSRFEMVTGLNLRFWVTKGFLSLSSLLWTFVHQFSLWLSHILFLPLFMTLSHVLFSLPLIPFSPNTKCNLRSEFGISNSHFPWRDPILLLRPTFFLSYMIVSGVRLAPFAWRSSDIFFHHQWEYHLQ